MAAYAGIETFESYSNGASLATLNGGSGWGGAWTANTNFTVANSPVFKGGLAMAVANVNTNKATRVLAATVDSGDMYFAIQKSADAQSSMGIAMNSGATEGGYFGFEYTGSGTNQRLVAYYNGGTEVFVTGPSNATWYIIHVQFLSATTWQAQWKVAGGAWSAFTATRTYYNSVTSPDRLNFPNQKDVTGTNTYAIDSIQTTDPDGSSDEGIYARKAYMASIYQRNQVTVIK